MSWIGTRTRALMGAGVVALAAAAPANAVLIAQENFDYAPGVYVSNGSGQFADLNGGTGWSIPFRSHIGADLQIEISAGGNGNQFNGSNVNHPDSFWRDRVMSSPTSNTTGTVTWQSMLFGTDGSGNGAFRVNNSNGGQNYVVSTDASGFYTLTTAHSAPTTLTSSLTAGTSDVVLVRTESVGGGQLKTSLWVAPNFAGGEAGLGAPLLENTYDAFAGNANIGEINIRPGGSLKLDDMTFGTDLADVVLAAPAPPAKGDKIGWQFVMRAPAALAPAEVAGLPGFEQANWNADGPNGQASSGSELNLVDSNGLPTGVNVNWSASGNSWNMDGPLGSPDAKLLDGFLNQQPTVVVSDIPVDFAPAGYSVIVYYNNNEGPDTTDISITGILDDSIIQTMVTGPTSATRFDENGYILGDGTDAFASNVMIFEGLDDLGFTIQFTSITGNNNNGITGFQIVANAVIVPEPATAMLIGLAAAGIAFRRRRGNLTA